MYLRLHYWTITWRYFIHQHWATKVNRYHDDSFFQLDQRQTSEKETNKKLIWNNFASQLAVKCLLLPCPRIKEAVCVFPSYLPSISLALCFVNSKILEIHSLSTSINWHHHRLLLSFLQLQFQLSILGSIKCPKTWIWESGTDSRSCNNEIKFLNAMALQLKQTNSIYLFLQYNLLDRSFEGGI